MRRPRRRPSATPALPGRAESGQIERYRQRWHTSGSATPTNSTVAADRGDLAPQLVLDRGAGRRRRARTARGRRRTSAARCSNAMRSRSPRALGERCEHPRLQPRLRVVGDAVAPHLTGLVVARVEQAVVHPQRVDPRGRHERRGRVRREPGPGDLVAERLASGSGTARCGARARPTAGRRGRSRARTSTSPTCSTSWHDPSHVDHVQDVVQLLAVHGAGIGVARRDAEQLVVAPLARAPAPRVEAGGRDVQDPREEVAPCGRSARPSGARGTPATTAHPPQSSPVRATGSSARSRTIATRSSNHVGGRRALVGFDDALDARGRGRGRPTTTRSGAPSSHGVSRRNAIRSASSSSGSDGGTRPAPELELTQLVAVVGGAQRQVDPAADAEPAHGRWAGRCRDRPTAPGGRRRSATYQCAACVEDGPLLGEHRGIERGRRCRRSRRRWATAQLGVHVADRGEERVAEPGPVHGVVGALAALERRAPGGGAHIVSARRSR